VMMCADDLFEGVKKADVELRLMQLFCLLMQTRGVLA
jgi:hypothetical protein